MLKLLKARTACYFLLLMLFTSGSGKAQVCASCPSFVKDPPPAVKNLASLAGCWVGKGPRGLAAKVTYELGSDKTALLETIWIEKNPTMYTMYYRDGNVPMAHHFCSYGNQLQMKAEASDNPGILSFQLAGSSNLPNHDMNHVFSIKFTFLGADRFDVLWGLHHNGRDIPQLYHFTRVWNGCAQRSDEW